MVPSTLPMGHRIHNRYRVDGHLGGGANGQVYEVWDEKQKITVALKLLHKKPPSGWWIEAEVLTGLRGDYILPILNADDEAGVPFVVTEVMRNGSTDKKIVRSVGVEVDRAALWIRQASIGVSRIHDHRLLHTDIKPANLFLDGDDNVLVGDLGLVARMDSKGEGHAAGSKETLAPEVARGNTTVRSDVYSLGATLYHLLAGDWVNPALHAITDPVQVYATVASHVPALLGNVAPHVPVGLRAIAMKAIDPDPSVRYDSPAELAAAIGARTRPRRSWRRDMPCSGHTMCFTGHRDGASTFKVCAVPTGTRGRHRIESRRVPAGTRINPWTEATPAQLATRVRARLAELV